MARLRAVLLKNESRPLSLSKPNQQQTAPWITSVAMPARIATRIDHSVVNSDGFGFAINFLREGNWVIMKTIRIMTLTVTVAALFTTVVMVSAASPTEGGEQFDAGATYKSKCVACHGQKAEKKFDASLPDQQLIDIVMKGKKPEKPPNMPAYGEKGITPEQAKALVEHMKQLKSAP